jgi:hypothetical protein
MNTSAPNPESSNDHKFIAGGMLLDELPQGTSIDRLEVSAKCFHQLRDGFSWFRDNEEHKLLHGQVIVLQ